jgi:hypothetical protein
VISPSQYSRPSLVPSPSGGAVSQNRVSHTKPFRWALFLMACLIGGGTALILRHGSRYL